MEFVYRNIAICDLVHGMETVLEIHVAFLAHLSQRLIGELIVYEGIRRPSVRRPIRPSVNIFNRHLL